MAKKKPQEVQERYRDLDRQLKLKVEGPEEIRPDLLLCFPYEYGGSSRAAEVVIDTEEFSALCPWTGLPDLGTLTVRYVPIRSCLELKSLKYYLLSFRCVGIVQEHAANRILQDLVRACRPRWMSVTLDYRARGGLHTVVTVRHH